MCLFLTVVLVFVIVSVHQVIPEKARKRCVILVGALVGPVLEAAQVAVVTIALTGFTPTTERTKPAGAIVASSKGGFFVENAFRRRIAIALVASHIRGAVVTLVRMIAVFFVIAAVIHTGAPSPPVSVLAAVSIFAARDPAGFSAHGAVRRTASRIGAGHIVVAVLAIAVDAGVGVIAGAPIPLGCRWKNLCSSVGCRQGHDRNAGKKSNVKFHH